MSLKTCGILIKHFMEDVKEFSVSVGVGRLIRDLPFIKWDKRKVYYEQSVMHYLEKHYLNVVKKCIHEHKESECIPCSEKRIWVMWWQGIDVMPPIVKVCYNQLLRVSYDYNVTLITKENFKKYIDLPDYILEKFNNGMITITFLSDIIRSTLLYKYGGAWFDATIYANSIPNELFDKKIFTLHAPGMFPNFISRGAWSTFFLSFGYENSLLPKCLMSVFYQYVLEHNRFIDYLLFDFIIKMIIDNSDELKKQLESLKWNRNYYDLNLHINDVYSKELFNEMIKKSIFQKLTYKKEFSEKTIDGKLTNYGYLIKQDEVKNNETICLFNEVVKKDDSKSHRKLV